MCLFTLIEIRIDRKKLDDTARRLQNAKPNFARSTDGSNKNSDTIPSRRSDRQQGNKKVTSDASKIGDSQDG